MGGRGGGCPPPKKKKKKQFADVKIRANFGRISGKKSGNFGQNLGGKFGHIRAFIFLFYFCSSFILAGITCGISCTLNPILKYRTNFGRGEKQGARVSAGGDSGSGFRIRAKRTKHVCAPPPPPQWTGPVRLWEWMSLYAIFIIITIHLRMN